MAADVAGLLERARDELYQAKVLVRSIRNSTKTTAAALADSEDRIDALLDEIDNERDPQRQEAQGHAENHRQAVAV